MSILNKWDIVFVSRFPESLKCQNKKCGKYFTLSSKYPCVYCQKDTLITNIVTKQRPVILWLDHKKWYQSMAFGIPLSASKIFDSIYNEPIYLHQYDFLYKDTSKYLPMRAMIHQATRIDGCVLNSDDLIGKINDINLMKRIEDKLINWLF